MGEAILEGIKCLLMGVIPAERHIPLRQLMEWGGDEAEILDESPVEPRQA